MTPSLHRHYTGEYAMLLLVTFHHETAQGWAVYKWCDKSRNNAFTMPLKMFYGKIDTDKGEAFRFKEVELREI